MVFRQIAGRQFGESHTELTGFKYQAGNAAVLSAEGYRPKVTGATSAGDTFRRISGMRWRAVSQ